MYVSILHYITVIQEHIKRIIVSVYVLLQRKNLMLYWKCTPQLTGLMPYCYCKDGFHIHFDISMDY
jgi:hypothetical protein